MLPSPAPYSLLLSLSLSLCCQEEKEDSGGEEADEDDGFFVPHGYLSEGEGEESGEDMEVERATDEVRDLQHTH